MLSNERAKHKKSNKINFFLRRAMLTANFS